MRRRDRRLSASGTSAPCSAARARSGWRSRRPRTSTRGWRRPRTATARSASSRASAARSASPSRPAGTPHLLSTGCYYDPERWQPPFEERPCLAARRLLRRRARHDRAVLAPVGRRAPALLASFADPGAPRHPWESETMPDDIARRGLQLRQGHALQATTSSSSARWRTSCSPATRSSRSLLAGAGRQARGCGSSPACTGPVATLRGDARDGRRAARAPRRADLHPLRAAARRRRLRRHQRRARQPRPLGQDPGRQDRQLPDHHARPPGTARRATAPAGAGTGRRASSAWRSRTSTTRSSCSTSCARTTPASSARSTSRAGAARRGGSRSGDGAPVPSRRLLRQPLARRRRLRPARVPAARQRDDPAGGRAVRRRHRRASTRSPHFEGCAKAVIVDAVRVGRARRHRAPPRAERPRAARRRAQPARARAVRACSPRSRRSPASRPSRRDRSRGRERAGVHRPAQRAAPDALPAAVAMVVRECSQRAQCRPRSQNR